MSSKGQAFLVFVSIIASFVLFLLSSVDQTEDLAYESLIFKNLEKEVLNSFELEIKNVSKSFLNVLNFSKSISGEVGGMNFENLFLLAELSNNTLNVSVFQSLGRVFINLTINETGDSKGKILDKWSVWKVSFNLTSENCTLLVSFPSKNFKLKIEPSRKIYYLSFVRLFSKDFDFSSVKIKSY